MQTAIEKDGFLSTTTEPLLNLREAHVTPDYPLVQVPVFRDRWAAERLPVQFPPLRQDDVQTAVAQIDPL